jgi:hypothetical protein
LSSSVAVTIVIFAATAARCRYWLIDVFFPASTSSSYSCICAFAHLLICVDHAPTKSPKNNEYTEDTIRWELFRNDLL